MEQLPALPEKGRKEMRGLTFTEDKIVVHKIRANFSNNTKIITTEKATKYFQQFGDVVKLCLHEYDEKKYFIVQFRNPEEATAVLQHPNISIKNVTLYVRACPSLQQPVGQKLIEQLSKTLETKSIENNAIYNNGLYISILNDYCLRRIFEYLPVSDQIYFAFSCQRLCTVFTEFFKLGVLHTKEIVNLTAFKIKIFLQIVGPHIKILTADLRSFRYGYRDGEINEFLGLFLTNVVNLKVVENAECSLNILTKNMKLLREVKLIRCSFDDSYIKFLETFENLKNLNVGYNPCITGLNINNLSGLEKLTLHKCLELNSHNFKNICKSLTNLYYLDIKAVMCDMFLNTEDYEYIAKYLLELKTLKIDCQYGNFTSLAQLPKLKILEINLIDCNFSITENFFQNLSRRHSNPLETLKVCAKQRNLEIADLVAKLEKIKILNCKFCGNDECLIKLSNMIDLEEIILSNSLEITHKGVIELLKKCLKLKRIYLQFCPKVQKEVLIFKSLELLQKQRENRIRANCVHIVFEKQEKMFEKEFPGVLKIIENGVDVEFNDDAKFDVDLYGYYNVITDEYDY